jgi:tetratricopeptide (TPR) repeat protein
MILSLLLLVSGLNNSAQASFTDVKHAYDSGQYFSAARMAFNDANHAGGKAEKAMAYAWVSQSLVKAGLDQSALYFFFRTIQLQDRTASRKVLELAPLLIERAGPDLMRKFLTKFTTIEDYSTRAKNAFFISVAKDKLLKGDYAGAIQSASQVQSSHQLYPVALQIKATAETMINQSAAAIRDFAECANRADQRIEEDEEQISGALQEKWNALKENSARDLKARCIAGQARVLYETEKFEEADRMYDQIPKASFVWTDTLFEHAWNSYAREEYNRTLGKLVSYKSPALQFAFNTEVDVLMAQSYMALCIYPDASRIIEDFTKTFAPVAKEVKNFVDANSGDLRPYFNLGKEALSQKLHTDRKLYRFMNRFVRSPYFESLSLSQDRVAAERIAIQRMDSSRAETSTGMSAGFPGFLSLVLDWRERSIALLGGIYVKNSMIDYHQVLISDFEKMQFMKIDLLSHMKQKLLEPELASSTERKRGNRIPVRRNDQMLWTFNGEFWNDEIGDYVFALESECDKGDSK